MYSVAMWWRFSKWMNSRLDPSELWQLKSWRLDLKGWDIIVVRLWIGAEGMGLSEIWFGANVCSRETCWIRTVETWETTTWFGTGAVNFLTRDAPFDVTSLDSSGSQKKENFWSVFLMWRYWWCEFWWRNASVVSSASGFQKKRQIRNGLQMWRYRRSNDFHRRGDLKWTNLLNRCCMDLNLVDFVYRSDFH